LKITELFKLFSSWKSNAFDILLWILVYISTICYDMDLGLLVGIVLCIVRLIFQQVKKRIEN
jgi:MFS superfamily sulfate permease-like transporter